MDRYKTRFERCMEEKLEGIGAQLGTTVDFYDIAAAASANQALIKTEWHSQSVDQRAEYFEQTNSLTNTLMRRRAAYPPFFLEYGVYIRSQRTRSEPSVAETLLDAPEITLPIDVDAILRERRFVEESLVVRYAGDLSGNVDFGIYKARFPSLLIVFDTGNAVKVRFGSSLLLKHSNAPGFEDWVNYELELESIRDLARSVPGEMDLVMEKVSEFLRRHKK